MSTNTKAHATNTLTSRQQAYITAYSEPRSPTFGNSYQSALRSGYSDQTARNFTAKRTAWMSDVVGEMAVTAISPEQIMQTLTGIINDDEEPTIIKLKAMEMTMRAYNMLAQHRSQAAQSVTLNIDLTGAS